MAVSSGDRGLIDLEAKRSGATLEGQDAALALPVFVALLTLIDERFVAVHHEVRCTCEFVSSGRVGARLGHAAAQPAIERPERGVDV